MTVAPEQSFTLFQDNPTLGDYGKEVRYFTIETDHGTYRHDWVSGKTERLNKVMP